MSGLLRRKMFRDMRRSTGQFLAMALTIMIGVMLFGASWDAYLNLDQSYRDWYDRTRMAHLTVSGEEAIHEVSHALPEGAAAETRRTVDVPMQPAPDVRFTGRVVELPTLRRATVNDVEVLDGEYLDPGEPNSVLVEQHMAEAHDLRPGDTIRILGNDGWSDVPIRGVAASGEYLWPARSRQEIVTTPDSFGVVFAAAAFVDTLGGAGQTVSEGVVWLGDGDAPADQLAELRDLANESGATSVYDRSEQASNAALSQDIQGFQQMAIAFPLLFMGAAAFATWILLTRLVTGQRRQVATLRAFGMRRWQLARHYLNYGLVTGLAGAIPGAALGLLLAGGLSRVYTEEIDLPSASISFHPTTPMFGIAMALLIAAASAVGPALRVAGVAPSESMRSAPPVSGGRRSLAERFIPGVARLPLRWRMVPRSLARSRLRSLYTAAGSALAVILILVSAGMIDTVRSLIDTQFEVIDTSDLSVIPDPSTGAGDVSLATAIARLNGVAETEDVANIPASFRGPDGVYETNLGVYERETQMHGFIGIDGELLDLPASGILLGVAMQDEIGAEVGSTVSVTTAAGTRDVEVAGFVKEPMGTPAYVARENVGDIIPARGKVVGIPGAESVAVRLDDGADVTAARTDILALQGVAAVLTTDTFAQTVDDYSGLLYAFIGGMLVLGGAMAFAVIYNTMKVNVAERTVELATLRAEGVAPRKLAQLIAAENLTLAVLGTIPGVALGVLASRAMLASYDSDLFALEFVVEPITLVLAAAAVIGVAVLAQIPAQRTARRLDVVRATRERME